MKPAIALSDIIATTIREEPNALLPAPQSDLWDVSAPISVRSATVPTPAKRQAITARNMPATISRNSESPGNPGLYLTS